MVVFFFQTGDGIRDYDVTGVQTCALPIWHPTDCMYLLNEIKARNYEFKILGREAGNLQDYDHINILTHPDAAKDQFPMTKDWILQNN